MTTLTNTDITKFDEKLKIYNMNFFSVINGEGLLSETTSIRDTVSLNIPAIGTASTNTTYSTAQFATFIRKIVNFNIKNYDELPATTNASTQDKDLCFIHLASAVPTVHDTIQNNIISTLKVVNVFVDILEAYKYCIDKAENTTFDSGYRQGITIDRIEIVSEKTRFYSGASGSEVMTPSANDRNVGYIRPVTVGGVEKKVLFLSIQSFETGMGDANTKQFNYEDFFTKAGTAVLASPTNILDTAVKDTTTLSTVEKTGYQHQRYDSTDDNATISTTGLTLAERNKNLIKLLIRTLYGLDITFRKQSVNALYYYYKFVQLYSTFIIHVSNVMYNDVKSGASGDTISPFTIETYNMTTNKKTHGVSGIEYRTAAKEITDSKTTTVITAGNFPPLAAPVTTIATITYSAGDVTGMSRGKGYLTNPTLTLTPAGATKTANTTIVPVVYAATTIKNDDNITRLEDVITEINDTINSLLDELATYSLSQGLIISTTPSDSAANQTKVYANGNNKVVISVVKDSIYYSLVNFKDKHDIVKDGIIYDKLSKYSYDIISATDLSGDFEITIDAAYSSGDIIAGTSTQIFKDKDDQTITKPATKSAGVVVSSPREFLELRMKDTNSYKTDYITTRNDISKLETDINFKSSKVTHQKNLYESQNNKKIFLERQILAYNIIIAVIVLILVGINVVKVDKEVVRTVSLSCFGVIILLFVIYFISNLTYVETFVAYPSGKQLYDLSFTSFTADAAAESTYKTKKIKKLNAVISTLNAKFINYFEKLIITLPAADNYQFYKEISEIITNDKENKTFTNNSLDYSKNQNDNNINSIKYELENNKLYINTLLISAVIFIGLYNMYINYIKDDKYLTLFVFVCIIIFIVILSYYYITANRRVKTVFKSIYWGPEFSKRF